MPKLKGPLKKAEVAITTPSGEKSAIRAIDPQDTTVVSDDGSEIRVTSAITDYVRNLLAKKSAEDQANEAAVLIRTYVTQLRDEAAQQGDYQKTYRVLGNEAKGKIRFATDVSHNDRFIVNKTADLAAVRTLLGDDRFEEVFEEQTVIAIKDSVLKNEVDRKALSEALYKALGTDGIKKYFKRENKWTVRKGMDQAQYKLDAESLGQLTEVAPQVSDTVKDATDTV